MAVLVFANGIIEDVAWIRPYLSHTAAIIAADGGTRHLRALGQPPDVIVGDMDSLPEGIRPWLEAAATEFVEHPPAKDETDLELALLLAASRYDDEIFLFGALGGRLDQTLANIILLAYPPLDQRRIVLVTEREKAWLVTDSTEIYGAAGDTVSLIPLGGNVQIEATTGLQWPLVDETLAFGPARGVSNVMAGDVAEVVVGNGRLLCIHGVKRDA
ncbi:MAG: thiamine diphosphokinase [Ardenticatenaceae bacterium]|nr:thiamine diphosphokinase [Ardenticatenaceae bacterium]